MRVSFVSPQQTLSARFLWLSNYTHVPRPRNNLAASAVLICSSSASLPCSSSSRRLCTAPSVPRRDERKSLLFLRLTPPSRWPPSRWATQVSRHRSGGQLCHLRGIPITKQLKEQSLFLSIDRKYEGTENVGPKEYEVGDGAPWMRPREGWRVGWGGWCG